MRKSGQAGPDGEGTPSRTQALTHSGAASGSSELGQHAHHAWPQPQPSPGLRGALTAPPGAVNRTCASLTPFYIWRERPSKEQEDLCWVPRALSSGPGGLRQSKFIQGLTPAGSHSGGRGRQRGSRHAPPHVCCGPGGHRLSHSQGWRLTPTPEGRSPKLSTREVENHVNFPCTSLRSKLYGPWKAFKVFCRKCQPAVRRRESAVDQHWLRIQVTSPGPGQ